MSYADRDHYGMYKDSEGPGPALMGADTLLGDSVFNGHNEHLGDIKEIMLDMQTGQVAYVVLSAGGFFGMADKLFAVPWQALHLDTAAQRFVLNVDRDTLKHAPGFNKNAWPDMADMQWANQLHTFYGIDPQRMHAPSMGPGLPAHGTGTGMGAGLGAGSASLGAGHAGGAGSGAGTGAGAGAEMGSGASTDPRAGIGAAGDDRDLHRIRGSNIG